MSDRRTYHGMLYGVSDANGRFVRAPSVAVGSFPGLGLVTGADEDAIYRGDLYPAELGSQWARVTEVWYRRRRGPPFAGTNWRHPLYATEVGTTADGKPVFRWVPGSTVGPARVCAVPRGDFICDG